MLRLHYSRKRQLKGMAQEAACTCAAVEMLQQHCRAGCFDDMADAHAGSRCSLTNSVRRCRQQSYIRWQSCSVRMRYQASNVTLFYVTSLARLLHLLSAGCTECRMRVAPQVPLQHALLCLVR